MPQRACLCLSELTISLTCGFLQSNRTARTNYQAWKSDGSDASLLSQAESSNVLSFATPGCCRREFQKLSGVRVVPLSGQSSQVAVQCTVKMRQTLRKVLKLLTGTTCNVAGVQSVSGTVHCPCHTVIFF
jgi:hypothetical protein